MSRGHAQQLTGEGQEGMGAKAALKYAARWNVPVGWLTNGEGDPFSDAAPVRTIHEDARYPNLEEALQLMRPRILDETYERQRSIAMHYPTDLSVGEWVDQIKRLDASVRKGAEGRPLEEDDDTPPAGR
jgi:hypothetical protein